MNIAPAPEQVGDPPGGDQEGREHDVVGVQHPRQRGDRGPVERLLDVRERDVDDRRVDERDRRSQRGDREHHRGDGPRRRAGDNRARGGSATPSRSVPSRHPGQAATRDVPAPGWPPAPRGRRGARARARGRCAFQSIRPIPSTWGVITRSACRRAAATVSPLAHRSRVRTIVSPSRGISASMPVSAGAPAHQTRASPGPLARARTGPSRPVTSTAITGPSPLRGHRRHRQVVEHAAVDQQPSVRGRHRREHARDREARVDGVD